MAGVNPLRKLLHSIEEEGGRNDICIVPKAGRGNSDEVSPFVRAKTQNDRGEIHPRLKEVQPADVGFPERRNGKDKDEKASTNKNKPLRDSRLRMFCLHDV